MPAASVHRAIPMPEERFDILFSGQLIQGRDPDSVRQQVGRLFKASPEQLERLFCGRPVVIKKGVDLEAASRYRLAFRQAGALVDIRPAGAPGTAPQTPAPQTPAPRTPAPGMTLTPANTGSLEDCAPVVVPVPLPDISAIGLGGGDRPLDETPPPPPAQVDISRLDLVPGQDWTLEDCQPLPLAELTPDISALDLAAPGDTTHNPPEPPARPLPDISGIGLAARAETGEEGETR
jgi:hypothetical protein